MEVDIGSLLNSRGRAPPGGEGRGNGAPGMSRLVALAVACGQEHTAVLVVRRRTGRVARVTGVGAEGRGAGGWGEGVAEAEGMDQGGRLVLTFGSNHRGQCGQGVGSVEVGVGWVMFPVRVSVEQVVCGGRHCLALSSGRGGRAGQRKVWAWGDNSFGQCGLAHTSQGVGSGVGGGGVGGWVAAPRLVVELSHMGVGVGVLAAGLFHSAAVSDAGCVYTWGDDSYSQLGLGVGSVRSMPRAMESGGRRVGGVCVGCPKLVRGLLHVQVCHVACGDFHTGAVTVLGHLYTWGLDHNAGTGGAGNKVRLLHVPHCSWPPAPAMDPPIGRGGGVSFEGGQGESLAAMQAESLAAISVEASTVGEVHMGREVSGLGRGASYHSRTVREVSGLGRELSSLGREVSGSGGDTSYHWRACITGLHEAKLGEWSKQGRGRTLERSKVSVLVYFSYNATVY